MDFKENVTPKLVDYNIKLLLNNSLKTVYNYKKELYNDFLNYFLFIAFFSVLIVFLYFRYKGKLSPEELYRKQNEKRVYVLSKLQQLNNIQNSQNNKLITNLPEFVY